MSDKQQSMGFVSYYDSKTPAERIAWAKDPANKDKQVPLPFNRKFKNIEQKIDSQDKKIDILIEMVQRFKDHQVD